MRFEFLNARLSATIIATLLALSLPVVAGATTTTPRPDTNLSYGETAAGESAISGRFQQIYPGTSFFVNEPIEILEIRFRPHETGSFSASLSDVSISLSTTETRPLAISGQFADNASTTPTEVYSGELELASRGISGSPSKDFNIAIALQQPFLYDPQEGNLLLDWNNRGSVSSSGAAVNFDFIGRRFATASSLTGDAAWGETESGGLATRFSDGVIPEPTGALLFSIAAVMTLAPRKRR
jgi:hypothetical protein